MKNIAKVKEFKLSKKLLGHKLPTNMDGHAGRALEKLLESYGVPISQGPVADIEIYGLEVKTRKLTATSAQTVATMNIQDIIDTPYKKSIVYYKLQQQLRIKTNEDDVIVEAEVYDFDQPQIQDKIEQGYEHARKIITNTPNIGYTPYNGYWGYFEQCHKGSKSYSFRFSGPDMDALETMTKTTFGSLFEFGNKE